jgi:hypothetical protein
LFLDGLGLLDAHSVSILPIGMDALGGREFTKGPKGVQKSVSPILDLLGYPLRLDDFAEDR